MLRKLSIWGIVTLIIALFVGCWAWTRRATEAINTPTPIVIATLEPQATKTSTPTVVPSPTATPVLEPVVNAEGSLVSARPTLRLGFQVSGRVAEVFVRTGDSVEAAQVLAQLDTTVLENAVRDARARLEQSRFNLDKARRATESGTDLAAAWQSVETARLGMIEAQGYYSSTLLSSDVSADVQEAKALADFWASELGDAWLGLEENPNSNNRRKEYELRGAEAARAHNRMLQIEQDAENRLATARRGIAMARQVYLSALSNYNSIKDGDPVKQAELQVMLDETALTLAQINLAEAELKAPWDAMVAQVNIAPGSWAEEEAIRLVDVSHLQFVTSNLNEQGLSLVAMGQQANIVLRAFPGVMFSGKVAAIAPLAEPGRGGAATIRVYIDLDPTDLPLRPGLTGQVRIAIE